MALKLEIGKKYLINKQEVKYVKITSRSLNLFDGIVVSHNNKDVTSRYLFHEWWEDGTFIEEDAWYQWDIIGEYDEPSVVASPLEDRLVNGVVEVGPEPVAKCTCDIMDLMRNGCKCGEA
jgi:hypothetical protein